MSFETTNSRDCKVELFMNNLGVMHGPESTISDFRLCFESVDLAGAGHAIYRGGECVEVDIPPPDEYTISSHPGEISRWQLVKSPDNVWSCLTSKRRVGPGLSDTSVTKPLAPTDLVMQKFTEFIDGSTKTCHVDEVLTSKEQKIKRVARGFRALQLFAGACMSSYVSRFLHAPTINKTDA